MWFWPTQSYGTPAPYKYCISNPHLVLCLHFCRLTKKHVHMHRLITCDEALKACTHRHTHVFAHTDPLHVMKLSRDVGTHTHIHTQTSTHGPIACVCALERRVRAPALTCFGPKGYKNVHFMHTHTHSHTHTHTLAHRQNIHTDIHTRHTHTDFKPEGSKQTYIHTYIYTHTDFEPEGSKQTYIHTYTHTDFKPEGSNVAGLATKNVYLYCLPQVLVLHLKRFQYTGATVKNQKVCACVVCVFVFCVSASVCLFIFGGGREGMCVSTPAQP